MKTNILNALKVSTLAIVLSFGLSYALAWTAPSTTPPTGNISAPINTSDTAQVKNGDFTARFLSANSVTFPDGTTQTTAGGNFAAVNQYTSATTLTIANDGGRLVELGGGGTYNLTLPLSSPGSMGKRISFVAYGGGPFYLVPQGIDCLWLTTGCVGSVKIASPGYVAVTSNGAGAWIVDSGTPLDGSIGIGQTWQNMTAYRTPGTTYANSPEYTNSTGKPIQISVIFRSDAGANNGYIYVDGLEVWHFNSGNYVGNMPATIIIPSGSKYRVSTTAPLIRSWNELR